MSYLSHVSNYNGVFDPSGSYQKFDFVYNTGDGMYYYARQDVDAGGEIQLSYSNRFTLDPSGPMVNNDPSYYIHDQLNLPETTLQVGQTISIEGSLNESDGQYKIINIERDRILFHAGNDILSILEATEIGNNWYDSSWFFHANPGETRSIDQTKFYYNESQGGWIYNLLWRWIYVKPLNQNKKEFWVFIAKDGGKSIGGGYWFYATNEFLGSTNYSQNSYLYINVDGDPDDTNDYVDYVYRYDDLIGYYRDASNTWQYDLDGVEYPVQSQPIHVFGKSHWENFGQNNPERTINEKIVKKPGWTEWRDYPTDEYDAMFYNHGEAGLDALYGVKFDGGIKIEQIELSPDFGEFGEPPEVIAPDKIGDAYEARIQIQGATASDSIKTYELFGANDITISTIDDNIINNPDSWSKDLFFFDADYGSSVSFRANNYKYEYGNGYYILQPKTINSLTFEANLQFKNRTNREANAIVHFLENHQGQHEKDKTSPNLAYTQGISGFRWDGNATFHPYDNTEVQAKKFYCHDWSHSLNFENSNDINVKLSHSDYSIIQGISGGFVGAAESYNESEYYEKNDIAYNTEDKKHYYWYSENSQTGLAPTQGVIENDYEQYVNENQNLLDYYSNKENTWQYRLLDYQDETEYQIQSRPKEIFGEQYWEVSGEDAGYSMPTQAGWNREIGYFEHINKNYWTRDFLWKPSIGLSVSQKPRLHSAVLNNGYTQIYNDGINESLLVLDMQFKNRDDSEAKAILHFLEHHYGCLPFMFSPPSPYDARQNFICQEWTHTYNYKNNHTISAKFEQFPFNIEADQYDSLIPPGIKSRGELIVKSPKILKEENIGEDLTTSTQLRSRLYIKNKGDESVIISDIHLLSEDDADYYKILGKNGEVPVPLVVNVQNREVELPSEGLSNDLIHLNNATIKINKKYEEGIDNGITFVDQDGVEYIQYNTGKIARLDDSSKTLDTTYFVNEYLILNNRTNILKAGEEGYVEVVFLGLSGEEIDFILQDYQANNLLYNTEPEYVFKETSTRDDPEEVPYIKFIKENSVFYVDATDAPENTYWFIEITSQETGNPDSHGASLGNLVINGENGTQVDHTHDSEGAKTTSIIIVKGGEKYEITGINYPDREPGIVENNGFKISLGDESDSNEDGYISMSAPWFSHWDENLGFITTPEYIPLSVAYSGEENVTWSGTTFYTEENGEKVDQSTSFTTNKNTIVYVKSGQALYDITVSTSTIDDSLTIKRLTESSGDIYEFATNANHVFKTDQNGNVSAEEYHLGTSEIIVYEGSRRLYFDGIGENPGSFKIATPNGSNISANRIHQFIYPSNMTADSASVEVPVTIKTNNKEIVEKTIALNFSKASESIKINPINVGNIVGKLEGGRYFNATISFENDSFFGASTSQLKTFLSIRT